MYIDKGKKYIVRCEYSGVFFGHIKEIKGQEITMTEVRCLWCWDGTASLLQLAEEGPKNPMECRFTMTVNEITVFDAMQLIPCSETGRRIIEEVKEWKA